MIRLLGTTYEQPVHLGNRDTTISRTIMDWEPAISLHDALARTIHYYQVNISIKREVPMQEQIIAMISEVKDDAQLAISLNGHSSIMEDGGLDSLQLITFLLKVEERFGIEIDFEQFDFDCMESVTVFCNYISELQKTASA
ncbi:acyl carrier protein [Paenibacillus sp. E222]|nr:phosphopantetheine-binding protein [Paenibacillus sp. E222]